MTTSGMVSGAELIGRALRLEGVRNVFTIAGDHVLPALDTMADMGFRFVDTRHEQAAAHMSDAWGRITGEPGVAMYTTPGFFQRHTRPRQRAALRKPAAVHQRLRRTRRAGQRRNAGNRPGGHGAPRHQGRMDGYGHAAHSRYDSARFASGVQRAARPGASDNPRGHSAAGCQRGRGGVLRAKRVSRRWRVAGVAGAG